MTWDDYYLRFTVNSLCYKSLNLLSCHFTHYFTNIFLGSLSLHYITSLLWFKLSTVHSCIVRAKLLFSLAEDWELFSRNWVTLAPAFMTTTPGPGQRWATEAGSLTSEQAANIALSVWTSDLLWQQMISSLGSFLGFLQEKDNFFSVFARVLAYLL